MRIDRAHVEAWVLGLRDQIKRREPVEDDRVEIKQCTIEPHKAARRIAGLANAVRGPHVLWIMGLNETTGDIVPIEGDLADWWSQVRSCFEAEPPEMSCSVATDGMLGLIFETERRPFVVKNPDGGTVTHEVPWREGTSTRSARHADLIRLLVPRLELPDVEILSCTMRATLDNNQRSFRNAVIRMAIYVVPPAPGRIVMPYHRCRMSVELPDGIEFVAASFRADEKYARSPNVTGSDRELICDGPGHIFLVGTAWVEETIYLFQNLEVVCVLHPVPGVDLVTLRTVASADSLAGNGLGAMGSMNYWPRNTCPPSNGGEK